MYIYKHIPQWGQNQVFGPLIAHKRPSHHVGWTGSERNRH